MVDESIDGKVEDGVVEWCGNPLVGLFKEDFGLQFGLHLVLPVLFAFLFSFVWGLPLVGWVGVFLVLGWFDWRRAFSNRNYTHFYWLLMGLGVIGLFMYDWKSWLWLGVGVIVVGVELLYWFVDKLELPEGMGVDEFTLKRVFWWGTVTSFVFGVFNFVVNELVVLLVSLKMYMDSIIFILECVGLGVLVVGVAYGVFYLHTLKYRKSKLLVGEILPEPIEVKKRGRPRKEE